MVEPAPGRPSRGFAHYLRDVVYGAMDGVITTVAVLSGAAGAALEPRLGLVLGLANLVADGVSMGVSSYLGLKSELEQGGRSLAEEKPWRHGLATTGAFTLSGAVPLFAFVLPRPGTSSVFSLALALGALALLVAGTVRARLLGKRGWVSSLEMLLLGALAAGAAFGIGALADRLTR